ncbi:MAG: CPBP family intramembrane metalloprotease [Cyclobacteriaceae bacterium]
MLNTYSYSIIFLIVGILIPVITALQGAKVKKLLEASPEKRVAVYQKTVVMLTALAGLIFIGMAINQDNIDIIGLGFIAEPYWLIGLFICSIGGLLAIQKIKVKESDIDKLMRKYKEVIYILPSNLLEYKWMIAVSFVAGIAEEIIFRGFIYWMLVQYMHWTLAMIIMSVLFSISHWGTGIKNVISTLLLSFLWGTSLWLTGSLWLAMLTHILVDLYSGTLAYKLVQKRKS